MSRLLTSEELTRQVADVAEQMQHHPDIELAHRIADTARRTGALHESETPS